MPINKIKGSVVFTERQKLRSPLMWIILSMLFFIPLFMIFGVIQQAIFNKPFGTNPTTNVELVVLFIFSILILIPFLLLFLKLRLDTIITTESVYVRFSPFRSSFIAYEWRNITKSFVRQYAPIKENGGWGVRSGAQGQAFNVSGNKGLQLEFINGKNLLIGTQKAEALENTLEMLKRTPFSS